tara:strand:- start:433 stop:771 length:339 start_codon:yes stop_codon:yes gene_type:complete
MKTFKVEELEGLGHYIVKCSGLDNANWFKKRTKRHAGSLSTLMFKLGYNHVVGLDKYCLIAMSDGWTFPFANTKTDMAEYLNNNSHGEKYRFATAKEVCRVINYQKRYPRCK